MAKTKIPRRYKVLSGVTTFLVASLLLLSWQRQAVFDQYRLFNYTPNAAIAELATDSAMTDDARRIYYVNRPEQLPKSTFLDVCPVGTEQSVVLGCYMSGQRGIYLLKVDNAELKGIEQVTAAHEMLHAAYDRLRGDERRRIDKLLSDYFSNGLTDQTIRETIEAYKLTEPNDLVNEMHSIFPTEIEQLPDELEAYYSRYFTDRSVVVGYYKTYEAAFMTRQQQIKRYDDQLNDLKSQIDNLEQSVQRQRVNLAEQRATLDRLSETDVASYNNNVDSYNAAVNRYNVDVQRTKTLIDNFNFVVTARNQIAFEERQLVESLSSPTIKQ